MYRPFNAVATRTKYILSSLLIYTVRFLFIILWYIIIKFFIKELKNVCLDLVKLGAPFDWVISIEVGEHIPSQYQLAYIGNNYNFNHLLKFFV